MTTRTLSPCGAPALILLPGAGATNTATRPTASRMVRDTGAILRDGPETRLTAKSMPLRLRPQNETSRGLGLGAFSKAGRMPEDELTIILPWPPAALSPNGRPGRWKKASAVKAYRKACADAAWNAGLSPMDAMTLAELTFCPPNARKRDDDNVIASFKSGQDGLADAMGADDADFRPIRTIGQPVEGGAVIARFIRISIPG